MQRRPLREVAEENSTVDILDLSFRLMRLLFQLREIVARYRKQRGKYNPSDNFAVRLGGQGAFVAVPLALRRQEFSSVNPDHPSSLRFSRRLQLPRPHLKEVAFGRLGCLLEEDSQQISSDPVVGESILWMR